MEDLFEYYGLPDDWKEILNHIYQTNTQREFTERKKPKLKLTQSIENYSLAEWLEHLSTFERDERYFELKGVEKLRQFRRSLESGSEDSILLQHLLKMNDLDDHNEALTKTEVYYKEEVRK